MFPNFWPAASGLKKPGSAWIASFLAVILAVLFPVLLLLSGLAIDLMGSEHLRIEQAADRTGQALSPNSLAQQTSIGPLSWKLSDTPVVGYLTDTQWALGAIAALGLGLILMCLLLWLQRIASVQGALDTEEQLHQRLFQHSNALAIKRGLSAQAELLRMFHEQSFPLTRSAIVQWLQIYPKHLLQIVLMLLLAGLIHPWLTIAAILATWIVRNVSIWQQQGQNTRRRKEQQRWSDAQEQLSHIAQSAPLMATIHNTIETQENYRSSLATFRQAGSVVLGYEKAKAPYVPLAIASLGTGLLLLLALGMLDPAKHLSLGGGFVWTASICSAIYASYRISHAFKLISKASPQFDQIQKYLAIESSSPTTASKSLSNRLSQGVAVEHITLQAGNDQKLLDDVSAFFKPGQLTAVVSPDPLLAKALVEMVLGFGQPVSGRLMFDDMNSKDLSSDAIRDHSLWIAPNGPLVTGTIEDNLWLGLHRDATIDMREITQLAKVGEAIFELPDGLQTLVSSNEQRLSPDLMFRLGIARAFLKKPSVLVAEEPATSQPGIEAETTRALLEARNHSCVVLVLPNRLSTLRAADQVVVLHHRKIADVGTHAELLERSELYRHWNFIHFAPAIR